MAEHLRKDPSLEVGHAWDFAELGIDDPTDYDCLVLLGWPAASNCQQIKRIELYCRGGGSLVALRAMHAEIPGWTNFAEEVLGGRHPAGRRTRLLEVQRSETAWHHPVVEGIDTMIAEGEVYCGPRFSPDTTVLLTADGGQRVQPVAWTTRHQGGRVFSTTLGLDDDFRELSPCSYFQCGPLDRVGPRRTSAVPCVEPGIATVCIASCDQRDPQFAISQNHQHEGLRLAGNHPILKICLPIFSFSCERDILKAGRKPTRSAADLPPAAGLSAPRVLFQFPPTFPP